MKNNSERETLLINLFKNMEAAKSNTEDIHLIRAPGRINLIGGHTDYNEGFVLPCTISLDVFIAASSREDDSIIVNSADLGEIQKFEISQFKKTKNWIDYIKGVTYFMKEEGNKVNGFTAACTSTVPIGSGLSSSAAFEVAFGQTINVLSDLKMNKKNLAKICYLAETKYLNISCGIMDQFISALGKKNNVIFLDCRPPYNYELIKIPLDDDIKLIIINSNIQHSVKSFINLRKEECFQGLEVLQKYLKDKSTLRDIKIEEFNKYKNKINSKIVRKRVKHIINENQRVLKSRNALKNGNLEELGELMYQSHQSLDELYDVSCPELNYIFNYMKKQTQSIGVRMTGAGKGGSVVCILKNKGLEELFKEFEKAYFNNFNVRPVIIYCTIPNGAEKIKEIRN